MMKIVTFGCERLYKGMKILIVENKKGMISLWNVSYKINFLIKIKEKDMKINKKNKV